MPSRFDLQHSFEDLAIMPILSSDRYQSLRSQILANAYLVHPKKGRYTVRPEKVNPSQVFTESQTSQSGSQPNSNDKQRNDSFDSSLENVSVHSTIKRDLEVAICRFRKSIDREDGATGVIDAFYAVVYDRNECSGIALEEQVAQLRRRREQPRCLVLTTKPVEDCASEEDALLQLCMQLEREANSLVLDLDHDYRPADGARHLATAGKSGLGAHNRQRLQRGNDQHINSTDDNGMQGVEEDPFQSQSTQEYTESQQAQMQRQYGQQQHRQESALSENSSEAFQTQQTPFETQPTQPLSQRE